MSDSVETWLVDHENEALETLQRFCRIPSISADPAYATAVREAASFVANALRDAGFPLVRVEETGGSPAVLAEWGGLPGAPTVLVYGHYDVQPPDPLEAWISPPFEPTVRDDRLYARGVSDDKGPLLIPIFVAKAFAATQGRPPVNLKFLAEGEEESGSPHFEPTVERLKDQLAADLVLSADGAMWRADLPSITVASRGLLALDIHITGAAKDLHSGRHGGSAPNPIRALVAMLATLHDAEGNVSVPGFATDATAPDPAILDAIRAAGFRSDVYFREIGAPSPEPLPDGEALLERQWLRPTLEFNGVAGGYAGAGTKTVIPAQALAKITCRLVAGQEPARVFEAIRSHLEAVLPNGYRLDIERHGSGSRAFALNPASRGLALAEDVLAEARGARPLRVAMGATVPIGEVFQRQLDADTVFFSFSTSDEDYHAPNEFFRLANFRAGLEAWTRLLTRIAADVAADNGDGDSNPLRNPREGAGLQR